MLVPLFGALSDRLGRRPMLLAACAALLLLPLPVYSVLASAAPWPALFAAYALLVLAVAVFSGAGPAAIAEIFPTRLRSTWMSIGYSFAVAIFGGFAPFVATWLTRVSGDPLAPATYLMAAAAVSGLCIYRLQETAHGALR